MSDMEGVDNSTKALMSTLDSVAKLQSEDAILSNTQAVREELLTRLMGTDPLGNNLQSLMMLLNDIDRTALVRKRINSDEKGGADDRQVRMMTASMFRQGALKPYGDNAIPDSFKDDGQPRRKETPTIPDDILNQVVLKPGEMDIGETAETTKDFMARMSKTA